MISSNSSAAEYRPKNFEEMIGQDAIEKTLSNAIKKDNIPQALLFPTLEKTCFWKNDQTSKVELAETQLWSCRGLRMNQSNKFGFRLWEGLGPRRARSQK